MIFLDVHIYLSSNSSFHLPFIQLWKATLIDMDLQTKCIY